MNYTGIFGTPLPSLDEKGFEDEDDGMEEEEETEAFDVNPLMFDDEEEEEEQKGEAKKIPTPSLVRRAKSAPSKQTPPSERLKRKRQFANSTSTIYAQSLITAPDREEVVRCMAKAIWWNIKQGKDNPKEPRIFNEEQKPLTYPPHSMRAPPTEIKVLKFLVLLYNEAVISAEAGVMAMAYIEKLLLKTGLSLSKRNWRRIVLAALMLGIKVWEDASVWNEDFLTAFPNLTVRDLNALEREFLKYIKYEVNITSPEYTKHYFELRSLAHKDRRKFHLQPLSKDSLKKLELRSIGQEAAVKQSLKMTVKAKSFRGFEKKSSPHILS